MDDEEVEKKREEDDDKVCILGTKEGPLLGINSRVIGKRGICYMENTREDINSIRTTRKIYGQSVSCDEGLLLNAWSSLKSRSFIDTIDPEL